MNFLIGKVLQVLYFPSDAAVKTENLKEEFLRSFFANLRFQSLRTMTQFLGNESRLKKLTEVSNYCKFICNIFGWDTERIGIIRAKVYIIVWI